MVESLATSPRTSATGASGRNSKGFTLTELAVVLVIVALLIGGLMMPLAAQDDLRKLRETQKTLNDVQEELLGFAVKNGYLPCPAKSPTDGNEDRDPATNRCRRIGGPETRYGFVPWVTLGCARVDGWNRLIGYSVTPNFADGTTRFTLSTAADISVKTRDTNGNLINLTNASSIPALLFSHGRNGYWAWPDGAAAALPNDPTATVANQDEAINAMQDPLSANGTVFVSRTPSAMNTPAIGEFDDIVIWLSPNILSSRMIAAGRLP